jgi:hypothetical protein
MEHPFPADASVENDITRKARRNATAAPRSGGFVSQCFVFEDWEKLRWSVEDRPNRPTAQGVILGFLGFCGNLFDPFVEFRAVSFWLSGSFWKKFLRAKLAKDAKKIKNSGFSLEGAGHGGNGYEKICHYSQFKHTAR